MENEESITANEHYDFLCFILSLYNKTLSNVVAMIGDNVNTNRAFSGRIGRNFVGFHSHMFALAVK